MTSTETPSVTILSGHPAATGWTFDDGEDTVGMTASSIPVKPPKAWFDNPNLDKPTALTATKDGRIYGHVADWQTRHIGLPGNQRAPRSSSNYRYYLTGQVETDSGDLVDTGRITLGGGHAAIRNGTSAVDLTAAVEHYDDVATAVADVACGEDEHGIWVSGALRPSVTDEQLRTLRASVWSGDWRPINRGLEMCAVHVVNTGGFPIPRAGIAASGEITALVAAGYVMPTITIRTTTTEENPVSEIVETTPNTVTENADTVVAAAPAPVFDKDQVVRIPVNANVGLVASVQDGRAIVQVEVPVEELVDAGPEARTALSASARERLMDSKLSQALGRIEELQSSMSAMVASAQAEREAAEAKLRGADALSALDVIPASPDF